MDAEARAVRDLVYMTLAQEGRAPSIAELARCTGRTAAAVQRTLRSLADAHALVLTPDLDAVRMAHPFSAAPMAFVVTPTDGLDDRRWWGGCAWDSFGISAALQLDVRIDTACPHCGTAISFNSGPNTPPPTDLAVRFPKPAHQWWADVVSTCTMIRAFCSRSHAAAWERNHEVDPGMSRTRLRSGNFPAPGMATASTRPPSRTAATTTNNSSPTAN